MSQRPALGSALNEGESQASSKKYLLANKCLKERKERNSRNVKRVTKSRGLSTNAAPWAWCLLVRDSIRGTTMLTFGGASPKEDRYPTDCQPRLDEASLLFANSKHTRPGSFFAAHHFCSIVYARDGYIHGVVSSLRSIHRIYRYQQ